MQSSGFKMWLFCKGMVRPYRMGEVMLPIGSEERSIWHILSGSAAALSDSGAVLVSLSAGEVFGMVSSHARVQSQLRCVILACAVLASSSACDVFSTVSFRSGV